MGEKRPRTAANAGERLDYDEQLDRVPDMGEVILKHTRVILLAWAKMVGDGGRKSRGAKKWSSINQPNTQGNRTIEHHSFTRRISCLIFRLLNKNCCHSHLSERRRVMYHARHYYVRRGKYDVCISLKMRVLLLYMSKSHHP